MKYKKEEVLQYVMEDDVKFIRLAFCDVTGRQKNISIMPDELKRAFDYGIAIDGSAIRGFCSSSRCDLLLRPEADTLVQLPWRPEHGKVVRMFCNIVCPEGIPLESDTRRMLKQAVQDAAEAGYSFDFGTEQEFYLFTLDEQGEPTNTPYDHAGYMDIAPEDKGENIRREICLMLEQMDIYPERSHHEEGPGQNEIDFRCADALTAADQALTFRTVVKTCAMRNGLYADFSPKPLKNAPGNGLHINISLSNGTEEDLMYMIGGILQRIPEITLFLNPQEESYQRFGIDKAPKYISWSRANRSQLIRIPASDPSHMRAELRSPDPSTNPYLCFALLIYAAMEGLQNKILPIPETNINLFTADQETTSRFQPLPSTRQEAETLARSSDFVKAHVPPAVLKEYCR